MTKNEEYTGAKVPGRLYTIIPQDEEIKKRTRTIIDAHVHILKSDLYSWFDVQKKGLTFEGDWKPIIHDYLPNDLIAETEDSNIRVIGAVHVQANADDTLAETREMQRLSDESGLPISIVGGGDLSDENVEELLVKQLEYRNFHTVRQILNIHAHPLYAYGDKDYMNDPQWLKGLRLLAKYNLAFDLQLYPTQFERALQVIDSNPDIMFIVNHDGMWADRDLSGWRIWKNGMYELGKRDNVAVKISGLASMDHYWTLESFKPAIYTTLDAFGIDKCMFASNFPVDKLHGSYVDTIHAYVRACEGLTDEEQDKLFVENARKFYKF
ncbi:amidohydrolase family protein [Bifidobacterium sp. ESL0745]|uniref:amidohydrolase family protein n=1 Tax=Bifidobacterium sp. ESL0745 TaxID=2983226 RepID=UPI0023FA4999|nr:amidohydrolase family protein [Bifidobacterium sp. ESL0745]MDF7665596.1 amidohydrolase family protein [Bifidobacterium sp. ESL0745]